MVESESKEWVELTFEVAFAHAYRDPHSHAVLQQTRIDYKMMFGHRAPG